VAVRQVTSPSKERFMGQDPVELPIDGTLDLHYFSPREVGDLIPQYLEECRIRGILQVRIVHGKGTGTMRARVHAILKKTPGVQSYALGGGAGGGWGATIVRLSPL
jgi:dsDNA-specific endonuclease/ATPase MutS2